LKFSRFIEFLQWIPNFIEKHVIPNYAEKQSEAKNIGFDLPLHCSSSSKRANGNSLDTVMW
jgi:hypothetical protein